MNQEPIERKIERIKNDNIHGSTIILSKIIDLIYQLLSDKKNYSEINLKNILLTCIRSHPSMALLVNFSNDLLLFLEKTDINGRENISRIQEFVDEYGTILNRSQNKLQKIFLKKFISISTIATYSASGTIQECLEVLYDHNPTVQIYCAESRPKNEGMILAKELAKKGIQTYLMTDASFFSQIKHHQLVVIGSDSITRSGIINKMGSYPLALLSNKFKVPFYCVTSTYKLMPYAYYMPEEKNKNTTEILKETYRKLQIRNYYFDTTPLDLFSGFITEHGLISSKKIREMMEEKELHSSLKKS